MDINYKIINQFSGHRSLICPSAPPTATILAYSRLGDMQSADSSYFCMWTATSLLHLNSRTSQTRNVPSWLQEYSSCGYVRLKHTEVTASECATRDFTHFPILRSTVPELISKNRITRSSWALTTIFRCPQCNTLLVWLHTSFPWKFRS